MTGENQQTRADTRIWDDALVRMVSRIRATRDTVRDGFPHYSDPATGTWVTTADGYWTGGFWVGELWLAGHYGGDASFTQAAEAWLRRLAGRIDSRTVFRGFLFFYGAVLGARLHHNPYARQIAIEAARALGRSFDPTANLIPLGAEAEESHTVGNNESNIDGLIASPLLLWAAIEANDATLERIASAHAERNAALCIQPDGSVIQSVSFDPATGALTRRYTHKGFGPQSVWTRAQAWAMLGYALCACIAPGDARYLAHADRVAQWWLDHVPSDRVAYWDFSAPQHAPTRKDTSGTAIALAALLKLAAIHPDRQRAARYADVATDTARALVQRHLTPVAAGDSRPAGILADGCFDPSNGTAVAHELIWGDYYLFESLGVLAGRLQPGVV